MFLTLTQNNKRQTAYDRGVPIQLTNYSRRYIEDFKFFRIADVLAK
jgi:hypothetical protein